jgi:hypothetical protein
MWKCYPIDRHLQMWRSAKSSCDSRHNSSQGAIEDTICVFFMRPAGGTKHAEKGAFTMNSMAHESFHT